MKDTSVPGPPENLDARTVDRAAAFAAGPTRIPRRFVYLVLAAAAVLGIGGALLEHVLSSAGLNPAPPPASTHTTSSLPSTSGAEHGAKVPGELAAFMGLSRLSPGRARPIALVDEHGQTISLSSDLGRVVVLSFFDGRCNDICPVIAEEIEQADADLATAAAKVSFLTVNTDPAAAAVSGIDEVLARTKLGSLSNWHMVTGPVSELDAVWRNYGITVAFDTATRTVTHNDVIYFLDKNGRFAYSATPSANERRPSGAYELPGGEITRFARGIATYAAQLAAQR